ncbi:anaerobic dehydrogenase, typically selenocysteine-containing [Mycolicibacterium conceptionense]|uniref:Anaerobic dehydrogenase, typically selenocysteine-containing n=1 Tax=Mycolicibacterium conceptionense TaxID=451644 RepID=A0A0U1DX80_9MYCO|nr:anaerobic dehydrogenase, typically selenocysteine-containing [Mycolicibacterium conceptionense]
MSTALRICPFCEATCGLTLTISDGRVTGARGDHDDVFSAGFICPKGASFGELDNDPDRLAQPLIRRDGALTESTWDEAYGVIAQRLGAVIAEHGGASVGVYLGNPNAHTIAGSLYAPLIIKGLGTRQVFSASTLDQMPKHVALGLMFGSPVAFTVPDLDRTDYLVVIGANPMVSNGSLATAADFPGKLRALRKRGGSSSSSIRPAPRRPNSPTGRWASRVSGYPEVLSELPAAALAEEIDTAGAGQIKAMITIAGNPVLSAPDGDRLDKALDSVDFMLSIDPYLNETTRHADVILPPPPPSQSAHFDVALNNLAVRNNVRYSSPALPLDGRPDEPEILSRLALILYGVGYDGDPALVDAQVIATTLAKETANPDSPVAGRNVDELTAMLCDGPGYERRLDMMLRIGPYGDAFGAKPDGLTMERLKANPHGIDLGPLQPRIPEILRTPSGRIELAPEPIVADVARLREALDRAAGGFLLIGRRHLRSNNSWMHNLPACPAARTGARCRSTPTTPPTWGSPTSRWSRGPAANCWPRSR